MAYEAGKKLDELIATKVFGMTETTLGQVGRVFRDETSDRIVPLYPYSSQPQYAWLVVEAMEKQGWMMVLSREVENWECMFFTFPDREWKKPATKSAPTAPLAICLAALKACGVDTDKEG